LLLNSSILAQKSNNSSNLSLKYKAFSEQYEKQFEHIKKALHPNAKRQTSKLDVVPDQLQLVHEVK